MIGAFAAARFFGVNVIYIILFCGTIGAVSVLYKGTKQKRRAA
jgi:hypothetical protein